MKLMGSDNQAIKPPRLPSSPESPAQQLTDAERGERLGERLAVEVRLARADEGLGEHDAVIARLEPLVNQIEEDRPAAAHVPTLVASAFALLGRSYLGRGATDRSADALRNAIAWFERVSEHRGLGAHDYGTALLLTGRVDEAIDALSTVETPSASTYRYLGQAWQGKGRLDQAQVTLRRAVELAPEDESAWMSLADVIEAQGQPGIASLTLMQAAQMHLASQRPDSAWAMIERALVLRPDDPDVLAVSAETLRLLGRHQEALAPLDRALALQPDSPWILATKGQVLGALGRYDEALPLLQRAAELDPSASWVHEELGKVLRLLGRHDEALHVLDDALALQPDSPWILAAKGQVLSALGRYDEALPLLERATELDPTVGSVQAELGEVLRLLGRYDDALVPLDRALELQPDSAWTLGTKGQVLGALGRYDDALPLLERAARLDPDAGWVLRELGATRVSTGSYEEAIEVLDQSLAAEPEDAFALAVKGEALINLSKYDAALEALERALALTPGYIYALQNRAVVLGELERHREALETIDQVLELQPDPWTLSVKASLLTAVADYEEALRTLDLIADDARDGYVQSLRAEALLRSKGDPQEARRAIDTALREDAENVSWRTVAGEVLRQQRDLGSADHYRHAVAVAEARTMADPNTLALVGWCHYRLNDLDRATRLQARALTLNPSDTETQFDFALVLLCSGQESVAVQEYERGIEVTRRGRDPLRRRGLLRIALFDLEDTFLERDQLRKSPQAQQILRGLSTSLTDAEEVSTGEQQLLHYQEGAGRRLEGDTAG